MSNFNTFIDLIYSIDDRAELEDLLIGVTTQKERDELSQRIEIVKQILDGVPQQKIASNLGVGVATVTRGSKELSQGRFKFLRSKS